MAFLDTLDRQISATNLVTRISDVSQAAQLLAGGRQMNSGAFPFGPLSPLPPQGMPAEQELGPRRWPYTTGTNLTYTPRGTEEVSFAALRNFARLCDIARICIQYRKRTLQGLEWRIETKSEKDNGKFEDDIQTITRFFRKPDKENQLGDWLGMALEEKLVLDALSIHQARTRKGELWALQVIAGDTIHPVIDELGSTYGYQQVIYGLPRTVYLDPEYLASLPDIDPGQVTIFPRKTLLYKPAVQILDSLYGFPPTEWIIITINSLLRKQLSDLSHFTEGATPDMLISLPDGLNDYQQAQQFEIDFNAILAGNDAARRHVRFLPWNGQIHETRPFTQETQWDEKLIKITCAGYSVQPQSIGFTQHVNKATGQEQEDVEYRTNVEPETKAFEALFTDTIETDFHRPELCFKFHFGEAEDKLAQAQESKAYLDAGATTIDEVRKVRGLGDPLGIDRPYVMTTAGPVWLDDALATAVEKNKLGVQAAQSLAAGGGVNGANHGGAGGADPAAGGGGDPPGAGGAGPVQAGAGSPAGAAVPGQAGKAVGSGSDAGTGSRAAAKALGQWRENSLNRLRKGQRPRLDFAAPDMSADMRQMIAAGLATAQTQEDVRAVFAGPFSLSLRKAGAATRDAKEPQRAAKAHLEGSIVSALSVYWSGMLERLSAETAKHEHS